MDACKLLSSLNLPVTLRSYDSGVKVIQLRSMTEERIISDTASAVSRLIIREGVFILGT